MCLSFAGNVDDSESAQSGHSPTEKSHSRSRLAKCLRKLSPTQIFEGEQRSTIARGLSHFWVGKSW